MSAPRDGEEPRADDLLWQRTLRQIRAEAAARRTRNLAVAAAVVVLAGVAVLVSRVGGAPVEARRTPVPEYATSAPAVGDLAVRSTTWTIVPSRTPGATTKPVTTAQAPTGRPVSEVRAEATATPVQGDSGVGVRVSGVVPGTPSRLSVVGPDDNRSEAARWVSSTATARPSGPACPASSTSEGP
ncbi:hypothetical protein V5P93_005095 [Actinokineospora auranticolor]|uniref:Uncharacterized protein n=1 Tax=Actinokineospora auranticolor TaxID=155976 RepID=A0A2S6GK87_9PSEU|nr:hypothetical protein [Actinokineospora auranticolor]PPK65625.1 hypothetical protein CLV40_113109 [Actinokineospora auranticolor]